MLGWGEVLQEIEIDTENFDLHRSIPVDEDVSSYLGVSFSMNRFLCVDIE